MTIFTPKKYQESALNSVETYFRTCQRMESADYAFQETTKELWERKSDFTPLPGFPEDMPYFCLRVPTGGGKTYLAAKSVALVNNHLLHSEYSVILWLVPSKAIRDQTLAGLRSIDHPYHAALREAGPVSVIDLDEAKALTRSMLETSTVVIVATRRDWAMAYFVDHRDGYPLGYWVRNQRWKLYNDGRLFDMQNDPEETNPVDSPEQNAIRKKLEAVFREQNVTDDMLNEYLVKQGKQPIQEAGVENSSNTGVGRASIPMERAPADGKHALHPLGIKSKGDQKPNIVVFCIDDLSEGLISCYGGGVPTPNIDKLAANGIRFTQGYSTAAMCSPARVALLTGRYQARTGQDGNFRPPKGEKHPVFGLDKNERTLADYLKAAGYATGISGKWHIGEGEGYMAADRGFDFAFGTVANLKQNKKTREGEGDFFRGRELLESPGWLITSPMYADEAVGFIDANRRNPFFLYVSFNAAHAPAVYSERWAKKCADIPKENGQQRKTAQVGEMDEAIGTVMEKIRQLGLDENTLVFCLSDNGRKDFVGGLNGMEGSNGLRGDKWKLWEAGIRVPWIVQWKGTLPAGRVDDTMVSHLDLLPTALAAAGIEVNPDWKLDGHNLLPLMKGEKKTLPRDTLYWRIGSQKHGITHYAIRQGDWKLVKPTKEEGEPDYLYNLATDRGEQTDLTNKYPEKKAALKTALEKWSAQMPDSVN